MKLEKKKKLSKELNWPPPATIGRGRSGDDAPPASWSVVASRAPRKVATHKSEKIDESVCSSKQADERAPTLPANQQVPDWSARKLCKRAKSCTKAHESASAICRRLDIGAGWPSASVCKRACWPKSDSQARGIIAARLRYATCKQRATYQIGRARIIMSRALKLSEHAHLSARHLRSAESRPRAEAQLNPPANLRVGGSIRRASPNATPTN